MNTKTDWKAVALRVVVFPIYLYVGMGVIFSAYELSICFNFIEWSVFARVLFSTVVCVTSGITALGVLSGNFKAKDNA
jgi:hypothetical protein